MKTRSTLKTLVACLFTLGLSQISHAQETYQSHGYANQTLALASSEAVYLISFASENTLRLVYQPGSDVPDLESYSVVGYPQFEGVYSETDTTLELATQSITVRISKDPLAFEFLDASGGPIVQEDDSFSYGPWGTRITLGVGESEAFWGTGSRAIPGDRRGYELTFRNVATWGYDYPLDLLNITIPFCISSAGYGLYFDENDLSTLDLDTQASNELTFTTTNDQLTVYLIVGQNNDAILSEYSELTGYQPLPPKWVLGYIQSKYGYETEEEARSVVSNLINNDFPIDGLVLDLQWQGGHWYMGNMDWDRGRFPNAETMLGDFRDQGVKTIIIFEPYLTTRSGYYNEAAFHGHFAKNRIGTPYVFEDFWAGNASILDITRDETLDWWWEIYDARLQEGVVGLWNDLGEPESHSPDVRYESSTANSIHNVYSLLWAKMLHDKFEQHYPERRLFNLIRSGYAGMQRYSAFPWSGDIRRSFSGMAAQIPIITGMSMSGVPYMHCDIGGFVLGDKNPELYTRWMQLGTFLPVMRVHGTGIDMEPYNYPEPFMSYCRETIKMRYRMFPYNYSLAYLAATTGRPLVLPMAYFEPENTELVANDRQFFWGESILVAPALEADQTTVTVNFPSGRWVDPVSLETHEPYSQTEVDAPIDHIPYFVRAGSFFPLTNDVQNTDAILNDDYHIRFFTDPGTEASQFTLFEDDGATNGNLAMENYQLIDLSATIADGLLTIGLGLEGPGYPEEPQARSMSFEIHGIESMPQSISIQGQRLTIIGDANAYAIARQGVHWDGQRSTLWIKFIWEGADLELPALPVQSQ
jgi:oligosaccharide 4-alpha-D-glucosyltransferase